MFGLEERHWDVLQLKLFAPLKSRGAKIWIFGSRARGDYQKFSDLDVLFDMPEGRMTPGELLRIEESLVSSTLPIKVDLVAEADLAATYRPQIIAERIAI